MAGLLDFIQGASNAAASNVSAPVDGLAWLLRKAGVPIPDAPMGGSDWMAQKGLTRPADGMAGLLGEASGGLAPILAAAKAPQIARGLLQAGDNLAAPSTLNKQTGAIAWHGPNKKNDLTIEELQDLISSQRYLDRDIVARKIKNKDFTVTVSPKFQIEGDSFAAITDGHHALEAAIRSGNKPKFVTDTALNNDRIVLLLDGKIDDFLESSYHDSPWYKFATKRELF